MITCLKYSQNCGSVMTLKCRDFFVLLNVIAISEGAVLLLPRGQALVCYGEELQLTCNTSEVYLMWSYSIYNEQGMLINYTRKISSIDVSQQRSQIVVNFTLFDFLRISGQGVPLISTLTINSVGNDLNGVDIGCTGLAHNHETAMARTTVIIINESYSNFGQPKINSTAQFGIKNVTVTLKWAQEAGVSYNVSIVPQVDLEIIDSTVVQLRVAYNVIYNVSIVSTLCGQNSTTIFKNLSYARCEHPVTVVADNLVRITGYHNPALEGTVLTFRCPSGKTLTGPNMTMCMENGEWEPDLSITDVNCVAICDLPSFPRNGYGQIYLDNNMMEGARVSFICSNSVQYTLQEAHVAVCSPDGNWQPNPSNFCSDVSTCDRVTTALVSSTTVFLTTSIVFMLIGFLCGRFLFRHNKQSSLPSSEGKRRSDINGQSSHPCPVYEAITSVNYTPEQKISLTENVAYDSVQPGQ